MIRLDPAPEETINLLEKMEKLQQSYEDLRAEFDLINRELETFRKFKAEVEFERVEDHKDYHDVLLRKDAAMAKRIASLESIMELTPEPRKKHKDQGDILKLLLAANNGKMPLRDARTKMGLSESEFSQLLSSLKGTIESKPMPMNRRIRYVQFIKGDR